MHKVSEFIVDKRGFIFLAVIIGIIFSAFSIGWVKVQNDLTSFLPDKSDSKAGVDVMMEEFTLFGSAQIMVANISLDKAWEIKEQLENVEGITMVDFGEDSAHYNNVSACYTLNFAYAQNDERCSVALDEVKLLLDGYDSYISSDIGNPLGDILNGEIMLIMIVAVVLIITMLLLTSKSVVELPVILLTFLAAMIINMGTNFIMGRISFVSNSVTTVLQLALSLDYAVIFCNRYNLSMENIRHIRDTFHIAIFLIEHDMNLVMNVCEGIVVVNYGRVIAKGTPEQIKEHSLRILETAKRMGRKHILAASDYMFYDIPEENVHAMCEAVREFNQAN